MTKIAIALFGTRVSPRFDFAPSFSIIEIENSQVVNTQEISAETWDAAERINKLKELEIDAIICGGIDAISGQQLNNHGIETFTWITGQAQDALECFLQGRLQPGFMMAPGGRCCGQWRCGQKKRQRNRHSQGRGCQNPLNKF